MNMGNKDLKLLQVKKLWLFQLISLEVSFMKQVEVAIRFLELSGLITSYIKVRDTF